MATWVSIVIARWISTVRARSPAPFHAPKRATDGAVLHCRFEAVHPFADGNGRTGRALALWELYRRGFDTHHIFTVDEYYWENRPRYYAVLEAVRRADEDLTSRLEYCAGLERSRDFNGRLAPVFGPLPPASSSGPGSLQHRRLGVLCGVGVEKGGEAIRCGQRSR